MKLLGIFHDIILANLFDPKDKNLLFSGRTLVKLSVFIALKRSQLKYFFKSLNFWLNLQSVGLDYVKVIFSIHLQNKTFVLIKRNDFIEFKLRQLFDFFTSLSSHTKIASHK